MCAGSHNIYRRVASCFFLLPGDKMEMTNHPHHLHLERPKKKSFAKILYDKETKKIVGKTVKEWGRFFVFFIVFYSVLAILFAFLMQVEFAMLNDDSPKWQLSASLIGTNPGVTFRPMPDDLEMTTAVVQYVATNSTDVKIWVDLLNKFLKQYHDPTLLPGGGKNQVLCDFDTPPTSGNVCAVDVSQLGPCSRNEGYSYNKSAPCIFVKLNRIYGWIPQYYDDVNDLPWNMPTDLKNHIKSIPEGPERQQVWVSCSGRTAADVSALGPVKFYPNRGLASYYYPFTNQLGYLSPLVAVQFERPAKKRRITIECRAWAKNVLYQRDRRGMFQFSLQIN